ncbi:MAG: hypothetical protein JXL84_09675 [Deltaproteobacteria bacterium]|nr:hypothetical protein [Deltaproteobacteria bacterium]
MTVNEMFLFLMGLMAIFSPFGVIILMSLAFMLLARGVTELIPALAK